MSDDGGDTDERLELFKAFVEKFEIELDDPVDSADDFGDLEELDISNKDLEELPKDFLAAVPPNLRTLALEKNKLTELPDAIAAFTQLTELYLRENQLTALPAAVGELTKLESLYLEDNEITMEGIPDELANLAESMLGLCLHRNLLTLESLPEEIGLLVNLKELDIPGNKLETLPSSFSNLRKIEILHAEENQLIKLPKGLGNLESLRKVYLQNNKLTKLHASLGRCAKIEVLNVEDNCLAKVAKRIGDLPKLKHLLLANNQITELPFNPLEKAPRLWRLTLSGNQLSTQTLALEQKVALLQQVAEEGNEDEGGGE
ncbi:Patatin-like phospholipase, partial [Globisporangium splendens]